MKGKNSASVDNTPTDLEKRAQKSTQNSAQTKNCSKKYSQKYSKMLIYSKK